MRTIRGVVSIVAIRILQGRYLCKGWNPTRVSEGGHGPGSRQIAIGIEKGAERDLTHVLWCLLGNESKHERQRLWFSKDAHLSSFLDDRVQRVVLVRSLRLPGVGATMEVSRMVMALIIRPCEKRSETGSEEADASGSRRPRSLPLSSRPKLTDTCRSTDRPEHLTMRTTNL